jgi:hypothetical protein
MRPAGRTIEAGIEPPSVPNLERRSRLRRLDDMLDALEALNLCDAPALSAGLAARLDELGIHATTGRAPFTKLIESVFRAQERYMIAVVTEKRHKLRRVPFDPKTLRITRRDEVPTDDAAAEELFGD